MTTRLKKFKKPLLLALAFVPIAIVGGYFTGVYGWTELTDDVKSQILAQIGNNSGFWKEKNLFHFASFRKHIGLYPGNEATAAFAEKLAGFEVSKGTIRLPHDRDLPEKLIADIARWCYASYAKKADPSEKTH